MSGVLIIELNYGDTQARLVWQDETHWHACALTRENMGSWYRILHTRMRDNLPDLDDPATKGCVLELVREKHKDPTLVMSSWYMKDKQGVELEEWSVPLRNRQYPDAMYFQTEAEALVWALEQECEDGR